MEQIVTILEEKESDVKKEFFNMDSFDMNLADMKEMEPIESPAFIWGKWNFAGS